MSVLGCGATFVKINDQRRPRSERLDGYRYGARPVVACRADLDTAVALHRFGHLPGEASQFVHGRSDGALNAQATEDGAARKDIESNLRAPLRKKGEVGRETTPDASVLAVDHRSG